MQKSLNIYQRLNAVMQEVSYVQKEDKKVNGQYTFVSHDAVTGRLHDPLVRHGIAIVPTIAEIKEENITINNKGSVQSAVRTLVKMEVAFVNIDKPEEQIKSFYYGSGIDPSDKGIGKAISYAVKYALLKTFCLETGDDVEKDNFEVLDPELVKQVEKTKLESRKKAIIEEIGEDNKELLNTYYTELKNTYKSKSQYQIFCGKEPAEFVKDFNSWKDKQAPKVA